eukprot:gene602-1012_t
MGWSGETLFEMNDGEAIRAHNVKRGDYLKSENGTSVCVECVLVTYMDVTKGRNLCCLNFSECVRADVNLNDYAISQTPTATGHMWNPVCIPGRLIPDSMTWRYLKDVNKKHCGSETKEFIYDIVLEKEHRHSLISIYGGIFIPGLGHNRGEYIIAHPYFGTNAVIENIKAITTYDEYGRVLVNESDYMRTQDAIHTVYQINVQSDKISNACCIV